MLRRDCLTTIGSTAGVLTTAGVGSARLQEATIERGIPTERVIKVRPGGNLYFEGVADPGIEFREADWRIVPYDDAGKASISTDILWQTYTETTGNPVAMGTFETPGWHYVTVELWDNRETHWWVYVSADAPAPPTVDVTCDPGPDETVTVRDELTISAVAETASGNLDRVTWIQWDGGFYYDHESVNGASATATLEMAAGDAFWFLMGASIEGVAICTDGRIAGDKTKGPTITGVPTVDIIDTNSPVDAGDVLTVTAEISAGDSSMYSGREVTADFIVGYNRTHEDSETVTVYPADSETVELSFKTAAVENTQTFPVRVSVDGGKDVAKTEVTVRGTKSGGESGNVVITEMNTNAPVTGGEWLSVDVTLRNDGDAHAERDVRLLVGYDPEQVDQQTVALDPGETTAISLGYETYPVKNDDEFPVYVQTGDAAASRKVLVHGTDGGGGGSNGKSSFAVSITGTNAPVTGGERLSVTATVENVGGGAGSHTVELVVGNTPDVVDSQTVGLEPGESTGVTLGYETYPVNNDDTFPVTVRGPHNSDTRTVTVHGTD